MKIGNKPIEDWKHILLDTGVILALFKAQKPEVNDPVVQFINKLVTYLCEKNTGKGEPRTFYISTISLGEIITKESGDEKIRRVLKVLDSENVEFLSFDINTALEFNIRLQPYLEKERIHKKAAELGFETKDFGMARQWISKDYMIAMSGIVKKVDVILTADKRTFYPLLNDFNSVECILTYPELFDQSEQFIIKYNYTKVTSYLNGALAV